MSELRLVLTTCGDRELAERLAETLVDRRLAACVNIVTGVSSTYRWLGKIERDEEVLVLIKTAAAQMAAIETTIKSLSGYDLPEVVALDITGGAEDYLAWVAASLGEERR